MMQFRQGGETEYSTGYVGLSKFGTQHDYQAKEVGIVFFLYFLNTVTNARAGLL